MPFCLKQVRYMDFVEYGDGQLWTIDDNHSVLSCDYNALNLI